MHSLDHIGSRQRGVTLVELMVTVAVLAVLLVAAVPSFADYVAKSRLKGAADSLSSQAALARAEAMRMDRNVSLNVVGSGTTWCSGARQFDIAAGGTVGLTLAAGNADTCDCSTADVSNCSVAGNASVVDSSAFAGVEITAGTGSLHFDRKVGVVTNLAATTISLRSQSFPTRFQLNVVISPLGNTRTCIPSGALTFGGYASC